MDFVTVRSLFADLVDAVEQFNRRWPESVDYIEVYALPLMEGDHHEQVIIPETLFGEAAIQLARQALAQFHYHPDQSRLSSFRLPGVVISRDRSLLPQLEALNRLKDRLREAIDAIPKNLTRGSNTVLPGVSKLQAYRLIHTINHPPNRLSFGWAGHTTAHKQVTTEELIELLNDSMNDPPEHIDLDHWHFVIQEEIRQITAMQSAQFLFRRLIAPHPRLTVHYPRAADREILHANLPSFLLGQRTLPRFTPLRLFDFNQQRKQRSDTRPLQPVIERIHLFVRTDTD